MTKETVRFPDGLVDRIRGAVDDSDLFESRSEFHRVSSELLLDLLDPDHEPTNFSYRELRTEIEAELGVDLAGAPTAGDGDGDGDGEEEFLAAYVDVRRRALGGDLEGAREAVDRRYEPTDPEALLLDEVVGQYREAGRVVSKPEPEPEPDSDRAADDGEQGSGTTTDGERRPPASADGGDPVPESGDPVPESGDPVPGSGDPASGSESGSEDALSGPRHPGE